jgi:serine/threonine-protein kinase
LGLLREALLNPLAATTRIGATVSSGVELGAILGGTYRIVRLIGSGGMGQVYEAAHERLAVRYAVKIVRPDVRDQPDALPRFMREAQVTSRLHHPGIVSVLDFNTLPNGSAFLVMEYLEGESLGKVLARTGPMSLERVADLTEQMSSALSAAHAQGIVHRDIHPQNVFVLPPSGRDGERIKILDFGISKIAPTSHRITGTAAVMGTPLYMSPEQAEGKTNEVDAASDQFSLAAMVYEMLTGKPAFSGDTLASIAYQVVHATPVPARSHRPDLPPEVENVVSRALAKNKRDRFSSVAEFAVHLRWTVSLAASGTPAPQAVDDGAPTLVVDAPDDLTPVSTLPSGMAAVLRETSGGAAGAGPAVSAAPRRWRIVFVSALVGGALALTTGLLTRPRAPERKGRALTTAPAAPASPSRALASPTGGSAPIAGGTPAHQAQSGDNQVSPARVGGPTRGRARPIAKRAGEPARSESEETTEPVKVAAPSARCLLSVGSYPWSELWVDGVDTGQHTPVVGLPLQCGAHKLELVRSDLNVDQIENVTLEEGRESKRHFDLPVEGLDN